MRINASLVVAGLLAAGLAMGGNLTQKNVERARAIIDSAVEAYGGAERLAALKTVIIEHETVGYSTGQSRKPGPPWDRNLTVGTSAIDLENDIFFTRNDGASGGFEFDTATIINGDESYQLDYRAGTAAPVAEPDFNTTSGPFIRVTPALLVRQLQEHARTAHYLGEADVDGRPHEVVGFSMEVGPAISLYFDKATHLLHKSERVLPFGLVEYRFYDYKKINGIPFNRRFDLYLDGEKNTEREVLTTRLNDPVDPFTAVDDALQRIAAIQPDELKRQELADGVYLIGGTGTYAMFVEMDDHVVAVGGTAGIPDRIKLLREVVPDKPIKYGVMTHHHFDHVLGVPVYAKEGATVIAAAAHEEVMRKAAGDTELKLETVKDRRVLTDGKRRIEIIDVGPTAHAEHILMAYLPEEGILFEADHFAVPAAGPVPPAVSSTRSFATALERIGIRPRMIASAHSPRVGTMDDLRAALDKEVVKAASTN